MDNIIKGFIDSLQVATQKYHLRYLLSSFGVSSFELSSETQASLLKTIIDPVS